MKFRSRILMMLLLLTAVLLVACGGKEEPTPVPPTAVPPTAVPPTAVPTQVPPTEVPTQVPTEAPPTEVPTATPEPAPALALTTQESEAGGFTIDYPEDWFANEMFGIGMFTSEDIDPEAFDDLSTLDGAVVIVMGGAMAETEGDDPMAMLENATGNIDIADEDMEIVNGPTTITINGNDGATMSVRGDADGTRIYGKITTLTNGVNSVVIMAIAPVEEEETFAPIFDVMVDSVEISEDEIVDPFGAVETPALDAINTGSLTLGEDVAGLVVEDSSMSWSFDGVAGDPLTLVVTPLDDELDVVVDVVDADGVSILPYGEVDESFSEETVVFDVPADGTYLVILHDFAGGGGTYNLVLTAGGTVGTPPVANGVILYTETISGVVPVDETVTHEFNGIAGDVINVVVTPTDDELDAVVDIWDADGNSIIGGEVDEEFDVETLSGIVLPADGTYFVAIRGFAGAGGAYELIYTETDGSGQSATPMGDGTAIAYNDDVSGEVVDATGNVWSFMASKGDYVDVTIAPFDDFDVVVDLVDSMGNSILFDGAVDESYDTEFLRAIPILDDGAYSVVVTGLDGSAGSYDMLLTETLEGGSGSIVYVSDEFTDTDIEGHAYPFTANVDEWVVLHVDPDAGLDVAIGVYKSETDELIKEVDGYTGREELVFQATELDNYYFLVTTVDDTVGTYDALLTGSDSVIYELIAGDFIVGRVADGAEISYGYAGTAGETAVFTLESDDHMDMILNLEDLDGNVLVDMDDGLSGEGEVITYTFEDDMYIFVNISEFYGDTGNFAFHIE